MRHIGTLIAAIVIGPLAWILIAFGQARSAAAFANAQNNGAFHAGDFVRPLIFLAAAGLILGLIATLRFSPLGATLTGVVYVLSFVWLFIDAKGLLNLFKRELSIAGEHADPTIPVRTGTTLIIGALLLVSVASRSRWRRWPVAAAVEPETGTTPNGEPYGLGPGDASMFRATGPDATATPKAYGEEPTVATVPAQAEEPESGTTFVSSERTAAESPATGTIGRSAGSPWSTPLRDDSDT